MRIRTNSYYKSVLLYGSRIECCRCHRHGGHHGQPDDTDNYPRSIQRRPIGGLTGRLRHSESAPNTLETIDFSYGRLVSGQLTEGTVDERRDLIESKCTGMRAYLGEPFRNQTLKLVIKSCFSTNFERE